MDKPFRIILVAIILLAGVLAVYFASDYLLTIVLSLISSHQYFAGSYAFSEQGRTPEGAAFDPDNSIIVNLTDSDFIRYPILNDLVQTPTGRRNVKFDRIQSRDVKKIEDFKNSYCANRSVTRYVRWNGTLYQIVVGQE